MARARPSNVPTSPSFLEKLNEVHLSLPKYYFVYPILILFFFLLYVTSTLKYILAWYAFCAFFSPHASYETIGRLLSKCFSPYQGYHWSFCTTSFGVILSRVFLVYPFDTLLYFLDEIFFSGYKNVEVKPFFVLGQPRSGTTKFESLLEGDEDMLCMKIYEIRFPYLSAQYTIDAIWHVDQKFLGGAIERFLRDYKLIDCFDEKVTPERHTMRRIKYDLSDEDDSIFLFHFLVHFQLTGVFPDPKLIELFHHFEQLSAYERNRMIQFHKKAVQKLLYRRGVNKRYFAKWVAAWTGELEEALKIYKDAKLVVFVRNTEDQIKSWFKLQSLLTCELSGINSFKIPSVLEQVKKDNKFWYESEIKLINSLDTSQVKLVPFDAFYSDIQQWTRDIYSFLNKEIKEGSKFDNFLKQETVKQLSHKATITDNQYITKQDIDSFPNLSQVLNPKKSEDQKKTQ